jgi:hypothetical protein
MPASVARRLLIIDLEVLLFLILINAEKEVRSCFNFFVDVTS